MKRDGGELSADLPHQIPRSQARILGATDRRWARSWCLPHERDGSHPVQSRRCAQPGFSFPISSSCSSRWPSSSGQRSGPCWRPRTTCAASLRLGARVSHPRADFLLGPLGSEIRLRRLLDRLGPLVATGPTTRRARRASAAWLIAWFICRSWPRFERARRPLRVRSSCSGSYLIPPQHPRQRARLVPDGRARSRPEQVPEDIAEPELE